jgi:sugar phosphate isomerase/epimerase
MSDGDRLTKRSELTRRQAFPKLAGPAIGVALGSSLAKSMAIVNPTLAADIKSDEDKGAFELQYVLSSAMYGKMRLKQIISETEKTGAKHIDIWRLPHGDQREQITKLGADTFAQMLKAENIKLGVSTCYPLGPFGLGNEMKFVNKLGGRIVLCGSTGPREPKGQEAKQGVKTFLEKMKPHVAKAQELGLTIAIENHDRQLLYHPDALRYFAELNRSKHLGIAFAPHHLHKWVDDIPKLIRDLGARNIPFVYGQEHSEGIRKKVSKKIEMQQMPGFGSLDYKPILSALKDVNFKGFFEIFMHPVPRGIPILPTVKEVTAAINKSRSYLNKCLMEIR